MRRTTRAIFASSVAVTASGALLLGHSLGVEDRADVVVATSSPTSTTSGEPAAPTQEATATTPQPPYLSPTSEASRSQEPDTADFDTHTVICEGSDYEQWQQSWEEIGAEGTCEDYAIANDLHLDGPADGEEYYETSGEAQWDHYMDGSEADAQDYESVEDEGSDETVYVDTTPTWQQQQACDQKAQQAADFYAQYNQHYVGLAAGTQNAYDSEYRTCMSTAEMSNRY